MNSQGPNINALYLLIEGQRRLFLDLTDGEVMGIPVISQGPSEIHQQRIEKYADKTLTIRNVYSDIVCQQQWETLTHGKYLALVHSPHQKLTHLDSTQDETIASVPQSMIEGPNRDTRTLTLSETPVVSILNQLESDCLGTLQTDLDSVVSSRTGLLQHAAGLVRSNSTGLFQIVLIIGNKRWREGYSIAVLSVDLYLSEEDRRSNPEDYSCVCSCVCFKRELKCLRVTTILSTRKVKEKLWTFVHRTVS